MKSRQRLEKRNQRFSEDLQPVVSKPQDSTTNSTALSQGNLKLEIVGQTRIDKHCNRCSIKLTKDVWGEGNVKKGNYICKTCDNIKSRQNRLKRKARVLGEYVHLQYSAVKEGAVYIITNKAWDGWVKVGMAVDAEDRLKNYQTSSPFRDYVLYYSYNTDDRRKAESKAHSRLEQLFERNNEWFKCTPQEAKGVLHEQQQNNG